MGQRVPTLAKEWATSSQPIKDYVNSFPEVVAEWKKANPDAKEAPKEDDLAPYFFHLFARIHPGKWPCTEKDKVEPGAKGDDIRAYFFYLWLREHPEQAKDIEPVPADMVMASGSGLDPHITLKNAEYQAPRVAEARKGKITLEQVKDLATKMSFRPLGGLVGDEPLVNVLELNRALDNSEK
jgi:K+-transporting ATPase ATPase C chain